MIAYRIPIGGLKVSTNKIYAGIHWAKRKEIKDSVLSYAGVFCRPIQKPQSYPVEICYKFIFSTHPLDTLNCAFLAKMFEDAFRAFGILKDDDPSHVTRSILEVFRAHGEEGSKVAIGKGKKVDEKGEDYLEVLIKEI